jgi:2'-5' RNA ligase
MGIFRSFVALDLCDDVRRNLRSAQEDLKQAGARVGWVYPENAHLTLVFLGDVLDEAVPRLTESLDAAAAQVSGFRFQVSGLGFFGPPRAPRIVWAGCPAPPAELAALYGAVCGAVRPLGFKIEDRPFAPHITIGRIRAAKGVRELTSLVASRKDTAFGEVGVRRLFLMRSHLDEPRARYSILHESPLKGN